MRLRRPDVSHIPQGGDSVARGLCLGILLLVLLALPAGAQPEQDADEPAGSSAAWRLVVDGEPFPWAEAPAWPLDSLRAAARRALTHVQRDGYYRAQIDSVVVRKASAPPIVRIFIQRGPLIRIGRLQIHGADALSAETLRGIMRTREGVALDPTRLERDLSVMLSRYDEAGYPVAQIRVEETTLQSRNPPTLSLVLRIDEGPALWLKRVNVSGGGHTSARFVAHVAQLDVGAPLAGYDPETIRKRLRDTGLFREVGVPELRVEVDGGAVLRVPLEEKAPGTFDVAFGYLPPAASGRSAQVVGSGHLRLENLFGGGRTAGLQIDRRPGQVSRADVRLADPYVLGWPLRLEARFSGEQRDSTYGKQAYRLVAGYVVDVGTEVYGTLTREVTHPGREGIRLRGGVQQIPRATSWFTGLGVRVRQVDRAVNPRRGLWIESVLERGRKIRRFRAVTAEGETVRRREEVRQERIRLSARAFVPTFGHQVLAFGVNGAVLRSGTYDRSDLFRFGGANTLRGYDEDRFLGNVVGRVLLEYRYQIDRRSFAYLFGDLGYVGTPVLADREARRGLHPGYGLGLQFATELGLVKASYGLNPEDGSPVNGRVHLGLSFGL